MSEGIADEGASAKPSSDEPVPSDSQKNAPRFNVKLPTLGGKQFWTDHRWDDGWRLQENAITGHWRVLSPSNTRFGWGTREACEQVFLKHVASNRIPDTHVVVLLHGLMRSSSSMAPVGEAIRKEGTGRPIPFEYASTRQGIAHHAKALREFLESLPGSPRIDIVAHSMGNIVLRHLVADLQREGDPRNVLQRLGGVVMLGPPNQGADIARQLGKLGLFELVTGEGGMQLGPAWEAFQHHLATPTCPFLIVAGDLQSSWMVNPIVQGPSDLVVRTEEAFLEGCADFVTVPVLHSFLMNDEAVQKKVVDFLRSTSDS